ncbi:hypothetical protein HELRODRAFT_92122, partial [Helobdella robusta]|uniref:Peflin n=1 Tax=Helobdella robusta TaxID=6412 RepID=T1G8C2_HELRO
VKQAVDEDCNGKITAQELQTSLMNNNCTPFNSETCRLMVGMFDVDRNGTIDIYEFSSLWKYIQEWRACFDSFDTDRSGTIDVHELNNAFKTFGYNLSQNFCQLCIRVFDRKGHSSIKFDDFIQCCVMLKVLSAKFMQKDVQKTGVIRVYYEEVSEDGYESRLRTHVFCGDSHDYNS